MPPPRIAGVVLAALLVASCSGSATEEGPAVAANEAQADGGGWDLLATPADEIEVFDTLAEMGRIADVVLIAQATGIEPGRDDRLPLVEVRFEVIQAISDWDAESVLVEFDAPTPEVMTALEEQVAGFPPTVVALREKGAEEAGFYRLVSSLSLWTEQPGGGVVAPLAEDVDEKRVFAAELAEIRDLEDLGDHLEAARRACEPACGRSQAQANG